MEHEGLKALVNSIMRALEQFHGGREARLEGGEEVNGGEEDGEEGDIQTWGCDRACRRNGPMAQERASHLRRRGTPFLNLCQLNRPLTL